MKGTCTFSRNQASPPLPCPPLALPPMHTSCDSLFEFVPLAPLLIGTLPGNATVTIPVLARARDEPLSSCALSFVAVTWSYLCDTAQTASTYVAVGSGRIGSVCNTPAQVASFTPSSASGGGSTRGGWGGFGSAGTSFTLQVRNHRVRKHKMG